MQTCTACKKDMADDANFCAHCGTMASGEKPKERWYYSLPSLLVSFMVVGPFMLPLLWAKPGLTAKTKIICTIIILILSYFIFIVFMKSINSIISSYKFAATL